MVDNINKKQYELPNGCRWIVWVVMGVIAALTLCQGIIECAHTWAK